MKFLNLILCPMLLNLISCANTKPKAEENIYRRILISHPTEDGNKVEFYSKNSCYKKPKKTIVFVHGHQEKNKLGGKVYLDWGELERWKEKGFLAVAISLPGYGGSQGAPDFSGEYSQDALEGVLDFILNKGWADPQNISLVGVSRGGIVAGKIASRRSEIKKLVLISTVYNLHDLYTSTDSQKLKSVMLNEMKINQQEFNQRSLDASVLDIKSQVLILHGRQDQKIPVQQAVTFYEKRKRKSDAKTFLKIFDAGHALPHSSRIDSLQSFILN